MRVRVRIARDQVVDEHGSHRVEDLRTTYQPWIDARNHEEAAGTHVPFEGATFAAHLRRQLPSQHRLAHVGRQTATRLILTVSYQALCTI